MKLIDADKLLNKMSERYDEKKSIVPDNLAEGFLQMEKLIKEQPTAYDIDKVVEELEKLKAEKEMGTSKVVVKECIDIVKQGVR